VAQDCIITQDDCGTKLGIKMRAIIDAGTVVASLGSRILGRTACEDVRDSSGKVIIKRGVLMEESHLDAIHQGGVQEVKIRSALTCELVNGICGKCYGRDLARGTPVQPRAKRSASSRRQSIGEPGHPAHHAHLPHRRCGAAHEQSFVESNFDGKIVIRNKASPVTAKAIWSRWCATWWWRSSMPKAPERATHRIQYGSRLHVDEGDSVKRGQRIAEWDPYSRPLLTEVEGTIGFEDLVEGQSITETLDEATVSPSAWSSTGAAARRCGLASGHRGQGQGRQGP